MGPGAIDKTPPPPPPSFEASKGKIPSLDSLPAGLPPPSLHSLPLSEIFKLFLPPGTHIKLPPHARIINVIRQLTAELVLSAIASAGAARQPPFTPPMGSP